MMQLSSLLTVIVVISIVGTGMFRMYAIRARLMDYPGERSSHMMPTPRGGGLVIVLASLGAVGYLWMTGHLDSGLAVALCGGGGLIAFIGFRDDRASVPVRTRMLVHLAAAIWAMYWLGGMPQ